MYPRNNASPERIAVGAVVQISDGVVQTSGVSISVRGQAGASGAGAGTTVYDNGIVEYTPTQGETDFTSFVVIAYKTGCIPAAVTIVTSANATAGYASIGTGGIAAASFAAGAVDAAALAADAGTEIATAVWAKALETGFTADRLMRITAAAVAGKVSGGPGSPVFRNVGDTLDQVTGTADANGNRSAATYGA